MQEALELAEQALALDPRCSDAWALKSVAVYHIALMAMGPTVYQTVTRARDIANTAVELSLVGGSLVVQPVAPPLTLEELLRGITDDNLPGEWDTGPAAGREVW